jgi:hypothetical protein
MQPTATQRLAERFLTAAGPSKVDSENVVDKIDIILVRFARVDYVAISCPNEISGERIAYLWRLFRSVSAIANVAAVFGYKQLQRVQLFCCPTGSRETYNAIEKFACGCFW